MMLQVIFKEEVPIPSCPVQRSLGRRFCKPSCTFCTRATCAVVLLLLVPRTRLKLGHLRTLRKCCAATTAP